MKLLIATAFLVTLVVSQPPPSNSYLPPPPNNGYPSSAPQIIAARTLDQDHGNHGSHGNNGFGANGNGFGANGNGFSRSGSHGAEDHGAAGAQTRFNDEQGYDHSAAAVGRNSLVAANTTARYEADERGFKPQISYENSEDLARSGYNSNANNFRSSNDFQSNGNGYPGNDHNEGIAARSNGF